MRYVRFLLDAKFQQASSKALNGHEDHFNRQDGIIIAFIGPQNKQSKQKYMHHIGDKEKVEEPEFPLTGLGRPLLL